MAAESRLEGSPVSEPQYPDGGPELEERVEEATPPAGQVPEVEAIVDLSELEAELAGDPRSFSFFQAIRLLERLLRGRAQVGGSGDPAAEVARFKVAPSIAFPASEIQALELRAGEPAEMTVNFMGLTGPLGVLPYYYTLLVADRVAARDRALKDFLDIFHHRIISLFYRAWKRSRFAVTYERGERDRATEHLLDLIGLGLSSHQNRMAVRDEVLLFYSGLLAPERRSAIGLEQLLEDYFQVPVEVEQFVGGWYPLSRETQTSIGDETSASSQLGLGAVAGDEIWDQQARVRVRIGPLTREQYDQFLPTGSAYEPLRDLTRFYCEDQFDFEVQLVMAGDEVPGFVVGADEEAALPLGWSTWIRTAPFERDADEAVLRL
ncbi:MAG: type VI secretion system baseplate subunit TssG [Gemmatimonadota bacterium]|nr:MAG: type VI secretion system baseplate subunit TssG [Gemmatimonadota bacterium]